MFTILGETVASIIWMLIVTFILMGLFIAAVAAVKRNYLSSIICYVVYGILTVFLLVQSYQLVGVIYATCCLNDIEVSAQPLTTGEWNEDILASLYDVGKQSLKYYATIEKYIDNYDISLDDLASPQMVIDSLKDKLYQFIGGQIAWILGGMAASYLIIFFFVKDDSYSNVRSTTPRRERERINRRYRR